MSEFKVVLETGVQFIVGDGFQDLCIISDGDVIKLTPDDVTTLTCVINEFNTGEQQ